MARELFYKWTGKSGKEHEYEIFFIDSPWNDVRGNYVFAKESKPRRWEPIYIGETESLKDCIPNHDKLPCIKRNGFTHVHVHMNYNSQARLAEEKDLLTNYTTLCNS